MIGHQAHQLWGRLQREGQIPFGKKHIKKGQRWIRCPISTLFWGADTLKRCVVLSRRAVASPHWVSIGLLLRCPNYSQSSWGDATVASIQTLCGDATARRGSTTLVGSVFPALPPSPLYPCSGSQYSPGAKRDFTSADVSHSSAVAQLSV